MSRVRNRAPDRALSPRALPPWTSAYARRFRREVSPIVDELLLRWFNRLEELPMLSSAPRFPVTNGRL